MHVLLLRNAGLFSILQVLASDNAFKKGEFNEQYIRYMQNTIRRMTEQPCELPEGSTEERAAALIHVLGEIGALELLEE